MVNINCFPRSNQVGLTKRFNPQKLGGRGVWFFQDYPPALLMFWYFEVNRAQEQVLNILKTTFLLKPIQLFKSPKIPLPYHLTFQEGQFDQWLASTSYTGPVGVVVKLYVKPVTHWYLLDICLISPWIHVLSYLPAFLLLDRPLQELVEPFQKGMEAKIASIKGEVGDSRLGETVVMGEAIVEGSDPQAW